MKAYICNLVINVTFKNPCLHGYVKKILLYLTPEVIIVINKTCSEENGGISSYIVSTRSNYFFSGRFCILRESL